MDEQTPKPDVLKQHQQAQEQAEREALAETDSAAEAEKHDRRADKARYLREKLEQQAQADRESGS